MTFHRISDGLKVTKATPPVSLWAGETADTGETGRTGKGGSGGGEGLMVAVWVSLQY